MKIKGYLTDNAGIKILAVLLAASLWFYVNYRGQTETIVEAPLEFKNIPKGIEVLKQSAKRVSVTVRGHERLLQGLRPSDMRVVMDLSNAKKGETTYYLNKDDVLIPRAIKVLRMDPSYTKITLDELMSKAIVVKANIIGQPERRFRVESVEVKPSAVTVEGARSEVSRIAVLRTEPLEITGLDSSVVQEVKLNTNGRNVRLSASEVTVKITIKRVER
jgi:YbbR domain-containing protein